MGVATTQGGQEPQPEQDCLGPAGFSYEIHTARIPPWFHLPTNINKYDGETDPSVRLDDFWLACRAGGATDDEVIICNLALYLVESARAWLEHPLAGNMCRWVGAEGDLHRELLGQVCSPRQGLGP